MQTRPTSSVNASWWFQPVRMSSFSGLRLFTVTKKFTVLCLLFLTCVFPTRMKLGFMSCPLNHIIKIEGNGSTIFKNPNSGSGFSKWHLRDLTKGQRFLSFSSSPPIPVLGFCQRSLGFRCLMYWVPCVWRKDSLAKAWELQILVIRSMGVDWLVMVARSILNWPILIRDYLKAELLQASQEEDGAQPLGGPASLQKKKFVPCRKLGNTEKYKENEIQL